MTRKGGVYTSVEMQNEIATSLCVSEFVEIWVREAKNQIWAVFGVTKGTRDFAKWIWVCVTIRICLRHVSYKRIICHVKHASWHMPLYDMWDTNHSYMFRLMSHMSLFTTYLSPMNVWVREAQIRPGLYLERLKGHHDFSDMWDM